MRAPGGGRPELALRTRNIAMGRGVYRAALTFWEGVLEDPLPSQP